MDDTARSMTKGAIWAAIRHATCCVIWDATEGSTRGAIRRATARATCGVTDDATRHATWINIEMMLDE